MPILLGQRLRVFSWTIKAFLVKHIKIIGASLLLGIAAFFVITKVTPVIAPYIPKIKPEERIGLVGKYTIDQLPDDVVNLLGQGLTGLSTDGSPTVAGLAKEWNVSEDGLEYTFVLKNGLEWKDNTPITSDQIKYDFKNVEREVIDSKTIKFKLKEPFAPFLTVLSKPVLKKDLVGSGPYKVESVKKSGDYVEILKLTGKDKDILFHFYATVEMAKLGFKLGEVDILNDLFVNPLEDNWQKQVKVTSELKNDRYVGLFFNNNDPNLGNKSLRQALSYAIKTKPTDETRSLGPLNPDSWAYSSAVKTYDYNPENANTLLKKVIDEQKVNKSEIVITISTSPAFLSLAEDIKKSWEDTLGIKVDIQIINAIPQDYQAFLGMQEIPVDPDQYALWHSTRPENITGFKDHRVDKLLEDGRKILDIDKRKESYLDFQRFLLEESPVTFISHPYFYRISRI
jgi:peptide/nickel transport system substrate-binding protein